MMQRSSVLASLLLYTLAIGLPSSQGSSCPMGCYCAETVVDCSSLMEFPKELPADTTLFKVSHLNVLEIPTYAFRKLSNITRVEFTNCNIASVATFAFYDTPSLDEIIFDKTVIRSVDSHAFNELQNITRIQFSNARIDRFKSLAFFSLHALRQFNIINTHIRNVYTHSFYNCSHFDSLLIQSSNISDFVNEAFVKVTDIGEVTIEDTAFWNMHCGVLDGMETLSENFYFIKNTFYCNCSLSWLFSEDYSHLGSYRGVSTCHGPDKMINISLTNVQTADLGCRGRTPSISSMCKPPDFKLRSVAPPRLGDMGGSGSGAGAGQDPGSSARALHTYKTEVIQVVYIVALSTTALITSLTLSTSS